MTAAAAPSVHVRSAHLSFRGRPLFAGLDVTLPAGEWTCLLGPSGVGKTTLLRLIAGLATPEPGTRVTCGAGDPLAGRVAYMAQTDLLLPWASVLDNVTLGARLRSEPPDHARARDLLRRVGLIDAADQRPAALSGGMRQRAALARTLMEDRPVILMDEPFSALDPITRLQVQDLAAEMLAGRTVLLVTHDPLEALRLGDRVHVMAGTPATLDPATRPPGAAPRAVDDPDILGLQGTLLHRLREAA